MKKILLIITISFCINLQGLKMRAGSTPEEIKAAQDMIARHAPQSQAGAETVHPVAVVSQTETLPLLESLKKGLSNQTTLTQFKVFITTFIHESQLNEQAKGTALKLLAVIEEGLAIDWNAIQAAQKEAHSEKPAIIKKAEDWQNKVGPTMTTLFQEASTVVDQAQVLSAISFIVKTFIETLQAPLPGVLPSPQTPPAK